MRAEYRIIALSAAVLAGFSGFACAGEAKTSPGLSSSACADLSASRAEVNPLSNAVRFTRRLSNKVDAVQRPVSGSVTTSHPPQSCDNIMCGSYSQIGINF
jgi:hypothetical protein